MVVAYILQIAKRTIGALYVMGKNVKTSIKKNSGMKELNRR
jgi:hypothetical protein